MWVGIAVRFAGNETAPKGRWLTFEFDHAQVEMTRDNPWEDTMNYRPGEPTRIVSLSTRLGVTVSGMPAARSTWPDWFPDHTSKPQSAVRRPTPVVDLDAAPGGTARRPHIIGGDLVAGGERPRKGGWL